MGKVMELKKRAFIQAFRQTLGVIAKACSEAQISRQTYYNWLESDKEFKREVEEINEEAIDFAENALKKQIQEGDTTAIIFYLKTKGKGRGYIERTELQAEVQSGKREELEELARKFFAQE